MKPPLKKRTTCRVQQKFNSPKFSLTPTRHPPTPSPHKNPSPHPPRPNPSRPRAFSGQTRANLGQKWAIGGQKRAIGGQKRAFSGRFWAFPGQNHAVFAPHFPLPGIPFHPGRCAKTSPPSPFTRTHLLHPDFPNQHRIALDCHK